MQFSYRTSIRTVVVHTYLHLSQQNKKVLCRAITKIIYNLFLIIVCSLSLLISGKQKKQKSSKREKRKRAKEAMNKMRTRWRTHAENRCAAERAEDE